MNIWGEVVGNSEVGYFECKKIRQAGLFNTIYWVNSESVIVQIQQMMDENYVVYFNLTSFDLVHK